MSDMTEGFVWTALLGICPIALYVLSYISRRKMLGILVLDGRALFDEIVKMVDRCRKAPVFRDFLPRQSNEYLSFFHYIYLPYHEEDQEKMVHLTARGVKASLLGGAGLFSLMLFMYVLLDFNFTVLLLGLMLVWAMGCTALVLWLMLKMKVDEARILGEIDKKVIRLSDGAVPPPYWASLADVMAQSERFDNHPLSIFGKK